jgi:hypothetical protein
MRAQGTTPQGPPSSAARPTPPLGFPTHHAFSQPAPTCPPSVAASSWDLLAVHVDESLRRASISNASLRAAVQQVVRELRAGGQAWDAVYGALNSAVMPAGGSEVSYVRDHEMHASLNAALVAHMHSWADVERLAEIESGVHPA